MASPSVSPPPRTPPRTSRSAALVASGILCSRLAGLIRLRVFAYFFGLRSDAADAYMAASRIPNVLQNLFGEGALSGSFIPVYAALLARGDEREATRVAGAVAAVLALIAAVLVLLGMAAAPLLTMVIAPGFEGAKRDLTIEIVRILFPGAGLLVMSAWCLGILNSHHRFLLSYTAPVLWNAAMIVTLLVFGPHHTLPRLATILAWGAIVGSALQFGVQVPAVLRLAPHLRLVWDTVDEQVRTVIRNFVPVFVSRGVVQISAYVDALLASLLPTGVVTGLANAQILYTLPVSLFGMSVSAAELPTMSGAAGLADTEAIRRRLDGGLRQIAFFVVPSVVGFMALGDVIAAALLQTGRFTHADAVYVWAILGGASIGLLASTLGRLYSSTYYALRDTRTPLRYAIVRVTLTTVLGYLAAIVLPPAIGMPSRWGAVGLTATAGMAAWVEYLLLRRTLNHRLGRTGLPISYAAKLWGAAAAGAAVAWSIKLLIPFSQPIAVAAVTLVPYGLVFLGGTMLLRVPESHTALRRVTSRLGF
ncbi:MAG: murein biosynthesis integral membrane protein MurJ [Acidobacteriota bacterium]|nr:murein biosynthesis integral membrane protein MurJ [Acidobacteriota bacterium]